MSDIVDIIISAIDQASDVFKDIVNNVTEMGSNITDVTGMAGEDFDAMALNVEGFQEAVSDIDESTIEALAMDLEMTTEEVERLIETGEEIGSIPFDDASAAAEELNSAISSMDTSSFDSLTTDAEELSASVSNADGAVQSLSDDLGLITGGVLIQAAESVGNLAGNSEGMAKSINEAAISVGQLATATGIAEPQIVDLIATISNETFPQTEAMAYVEALHQMGVEASNFGTSATDMDRINDAFGIGYSNVIQLTRGMSVLGVDANNLSTSFNALAYANSNVNGGVSTLTTVLGRQGATFQELGLDIDQVSVVMGAASHKWTTARTLNSGLSKALKECGGDLRALEKELGLKSGALDNASQTTGKYKGQVQDLASEEKEHKTILERLGAAWEDVTLKTSSALSPLAGAISVVGDVGQFGLQVQGIRNMGQAFKDTANWVRELSIVESVLNAIRGVSATETAVLNAEEMALAATQAGLTAEEVGAAMAHATNGAAIAGEGVAAAGASTGFWALAAAVIGATWPILLAVGAAAAFVYAIYEVGKAFGWWTDVSSMLDAVWAGINRLWSAFINHPDVQSFIQGLSDVWNSLVSSVQSVGQAILEFFGINESGNFDIVATIINTVGAAWEGFKGILTTVVDAFNTVQNALGPFGSSLLVILGPVGTIVAALRGIVCILLGCSPGIVPALLTTLATFSTVWTAITGVVSSMVSSVVGFLTRLVNRITHFATNAVNQAKKAGKGLYNGVVNAILNLPGRAYTILSNVVNKIISAGRSWVSNAKSYASSVVTGVTDKISGLPGKVADEFGKIGGKINDSVSSAVSAAANFGDNIKNAVLNALHIASPGIIQRKIKSEFWDTVDRINETVRPAYEAGKSYGENILNGFNSVDLSKDNLLETTDFNTAIDVNGNSFDIRTGEYYEVDNNMEVTVKQEHEFVFSFKDVPEWIDTDKLLALIKKCMSDKTVIKELVSNPDFQALDNQVKTRILRKVNRSRGV